MGTEIIPLSLEQVCRQFFATVAVIIAKGGGHGGYGDTVRQGHRTHIAPTLLIGIHYRLKIGIQQKVGYIRIFIKGFFNFA